MPRPWWNGGPCVRRGSPSPGSSTFTTSAPRSASSIVQYGPANTRVKSMTFRPAKGFFPCCTGTSVQAHAGGLGDLAPLGGLAGDVLREFLGRAVDHLGAGFFEALLDAGRLQLLA